MIKVGKIYKAKEGSCHAYEEAEPVIVVDYDETDELYACYSVSDSPLLQHVYAEELGKVVRADSKLYDKAADIIDALASGVAEIQEQLEPDAELEVFDDSQAIEMNVNVGLKTIFGEITFPEDYSCIIHDIYREMNCKDEEEAESYFNAFADQGLCTGYVIPANFHGQIVDTRFAEKQ